jgi:peptidoglycan DL-endopeptidase CwlO
VQQLALAMLLDDGGRALARGLAALAIVLLLALFVAVLVPVAVLAGVGVVPVTGPPAMAAAPSPVAGLSVAPAAGSRPVDVARGYLGVRYVFGGTDPATGLDCSGLVQVVFRQIGAWLPRTAQLQYEATPRVPPDQLQPGDLVFFARTYADPHDWITHVGIYIGDGQQINAPTEGQVVSIQPVFSGFWGAHFVGGGRVGRP